VPSIPPDAVVPEVEAQPDATEVDAPVEPVDAGSARGTARPTPEDTMSSLSGDEGAAPAVPSPSELDASPSIPIEVGSMVSAPVAPREDEAPSSDSDPEAPSRTPLSSVASHDPVAERPVPRSRWPWIVAIAVVCGAVVLGAQSVTPGEPPAAAAPTQDPVATLPLTSGAPTALEATAAKTDAGRSARAPRPATP
jgi:hypothetical protein